MGDTVLRREESSEMMILPIRVAAAANWLLSFCSERRRSTRSSTQVCGDFMIRWNSPFQSRALGREINTSLCVRPCEEEEEEEEVEEDEEPEEAKPEEEALAEEEEAATEGERVCG
jgi:hypothetical protein